MFNKTMTAAIFLAFLSAATASAQDYSKYIWEFPQASAIQLPADRQWMLDDLRSEIDKVLAAGHIAPYYINTADLAHEGYFLYAEPGRIITTLAWAYPHLTPAAQAKVKDYVHAEFANPKYCPWGEKALPWQEGAGREGRAKPAGFNFDRWWGMEGQNRPVLHTLYGVWLYGYRTGDWAAIEPYWPKIRAYYVSRAKDANIYQEFSAHIAVARLAYQFKDSSMETGAIEHANACFSAGKDYAAVEKASIKNFNRLKEKRHDYLANTSFMVMNISPEIGRYLKDDVAVPVISKNNHLKEHWTHWWLIEPPYFGTWAGNLGSDNEGIGLPREIFSMIYPIERWVAGADVNTLSSYMSSGPEGLGDCYWIEPLVWTIEAHGKTDWVDVRTTPQP